MNTVREFDVVTAATLRLVIRSKLDNGISRRAVSQLIAEYVPPEVRKLRKDSREYRLPVELIPFDQRIAFLGISQTQPRRPRQRNYRAICRGNLKPWLIVFGSLM